MEPDATPITRPRLPDEVRALFWEYDADVLSWDTDRDLIVRRVLTAGDWSAVTWLRDRLGDDALRAWIERHQGGGLNPRQLRFWELVLALPPHEVNDWIEAAQTSVWEARTSA